MDMLMDREVIRNEALLLLIYLTHEAEEIQKILVFEGTFEKIFIIIKEEGCSEGVVVVQVLLRETMGFDPLISILKLKGSSYSFTQQRKKVFDHFLMLGVESQWAPVPVRCTIVQSELCHSFQRMLKAGDYYISISCSIIFNGKREYN
ncbi:Golgin candidate 6 [Camellia lanceoleosa]|uniref:Golgin candidate 6 n=1 Tax=Camellia lanceoleosa TaxID=1840588 RepID=A0ACC0G272_9ERIC|nr:Golgin candidate 6 [Camellia lanceoleosa]